MARDLDCAAVAHSRRTNNKFFSDSPFPFSSSSTLVVLAALLLGVGCAATTKTAYAQDLSGKIMTKGRKVEEEGKVVGAAAAAEEFTPFPPPELLSSSLSSSPSTAEKSSRSSPASKKKVTKMYVLSDVHLDLFFGTPQAVGMCTSPPNANTKYGTITCDSSLPLVTSTMDDIFNQSMKDSNSIFLLLGDVLRHNIEKFADYNFSSPSGAGGSSSIGAQPGGEKARKRGGFRGADEEDGSGVLGGTAKKQKKKKIAVNAEGEDEGLAAARRRTFNIAAVGGGGRIHASYSSLFPAQQQQEDLLTTTATSGFDHSIEVEDNGRDALANGDENGSDLDGADSEEYYRRFEYPLKIAAESTDIVAKMIKSRFDKISSVIPHPNLVSALGNNDCVPHYFMEKLKNAAAVVNFTEVFLRNGLVSQEEQNEWKVCGYFSRLINPTAANKKATGRPPLLVLNINSVFYSDKADINGGGRIADPCGQFLWMTAQMQKARENGYKVTIVGHIIPMVGKWLDNYIAVYISLLRANNDVIASQFFSHTHMFTFLTLTNDDSTGPIFDIPSISPITGNNPSYVAVAFDDQWRVSEVYHRYLSPDQKTWYDGAVFGRDFGLHSTPAASTNGGKGVDEKVEEAQNEELDKDEDLSSLSKKVAVGAGALTSSRLYQFAVSLMFVDKKDVKWQQFQSLHQGGFMSQTIVPFGNKDKRKILCRMVSRSTPEYESCRGKDF